MSPFDREKFYKRIGVDPEARAKGSDEIEMIQVEEAVCETVSVDEFADKSAIVEIERCRDISEVRRKKPDLRGFDYDAFCRR